MLHALTAPCGAIGTHPRRYSGSRCASSGRIQVRWIQVARCDAGGAGDEPRASKPKRAARVPRRVPRPDAAPGGESPTPATNKKPTVRVRKPTDRGKSLTDEEKAIRMREIKEKAAAPRVAELADAVRDACAQGEYKGASAAYADLKQVPHGIVPPDVFEEMLNLCSTLRMPSSAEGVFIDSLAAGHAPSQAACWKLLETFESAGENTRAEKVLAYMESRGMS